MKKDAVLITIIGLLIILIIRIIWNVNLVPLAISFSAGLLVGTITTLRSLEDQE